MHARAFAFFEKCGIQWRREYIFDEGVFSGEPAYWRESCCVDVGPLGVIDIVSDMKPNDTPPNDMVLELANRKLAFELALHGNGRKRDTRRPHEHAGCFFKANGFKLVDLRWMLERRSVHVFSKGQRDKICDESPVSQMFT